MSMRVRTPLLVIAASITLLTACGGDDKPKETSSSTATAPGPSASPALPTVNADGILGGNFTKDFRAKYPAFAKGRTDEAVANAGVQVCREVVKGDATRADLLKEATEAFTSKSEKPKEAQTLQMMELAIKDGCPDRWAMLQKLVS